MQLVFALTYVNKLKIIPSYMCALLVLLPKYFPKNVFGKL